jgi:hypothetical protein
MEASSEHPIPPQYLPPRPNNIMLILSGIVFFLFLSGTWFIRMAFCPGQTLPWRGLNLLFAALLLFLPGRTAWVSIARKWRTGRWTISPEERAQRWAKYAARHNPARFKTTMAFLDAAAAIVWSALLAQWIAKEIYSSLHGGSRSLSPLWLGIIVLNLWFLYRRRDWASTPKP